MHLGSEDYAATHSLFQASAMLYEHEDERSKAIRTFLIKGIRRHHIATLDGQGMRADGSCQVLCGDLLALAGLEEEKNEIGTGGCDPSHQCGLGYRLYYAQKEARGYVPSFPKLFHIDIRYM